MRSRFVIALSGAAMIGAVLLPGADWLTFGGDPQRSGWAQKETRLNRDTAKSLALEWKLKLDNAPKELNSLMPPIVVEQVYTPHGVKDVVIEAGASDTLFAIDVDRGKVLWQKKFEIEGQSRQKPHWLCPNALNDTPVIEKGGRGLGEKTVHVISSDGKLHSLNVINGEDRQPPKQFVPPFSKNWSLNLLDGVLYTTISQGCNGAKSGVYAMDLRDPERPVRFFQSAPAGGGIWGRAGAAVSPEGVVFVETGDGPYDAAQHKFPDSVLALSAKDLRLLDYYTPANREWITKKDLDMGNTTPAVFPFRQWELVAAAGKEGVIYLLDAKSLGGSSHREPLFRSPLYLNEDVDFAGRGVWGAFATWQDGQGARWLYAPAWGPLHSEAPKFAIRNGEAPNGSILGFRVEEKDGKPQLAPAWVSRDMNVPEPPVVVNGVVLAVSSGENVRQLDTEGHLLTSEQRATHPTGHATLYAFDAQTGKELFSSGDTMPSFTHFSGLAVAGGRVYVSNYDGTLYAFGVKD
ncbi:MAG TPA: PQQ-binding-like beta-propeller repeat protein [Bryobacteraceae bacterium]|nr:PQQ-binding-like beta-propeller repeat protein [Bryobacteraceae bacterium]